MFEQSSRLKGLQILIVDDRCEDCLMLSTLLEMHEAEVTSAHSAQEAIALFARKTADILISDLAMPFEDGYSLIRQIRALAPNQGGQIPAIALTALTTPEDRRHALEAGFQAYLTKPLEIDQLINTVVDFASSGVSLVSTALEQKISGCVQRLLSPSC